MKHLVSPLDIRTIRALHIGDVVSLSGDILTGRDEVHIRALEYIKEGKPIPMDLNGATLYHCGPIISKKDNRWTVIAAGPTTSARMDSLEPEMIKCFGIKAIIGKGGMSKEVLDTMEECGCVYMAATGGAAVSLAESISSVVSVEWEDLGMPEAMWKFKVDNLSPLIVAMDSHGNSLYEDVRRSLIRDI
jgi:fumarate hydratase subunit beta